MNARIGNRQPAKQREPQRDYQEKQNGDRQQFVSRQPGKDALDTPKEALGTARHENRRQPKGEREQNRNGWLSEPSGNRGIHREFGKSSEKC
jgi:hypothetical protein